MKAPGPYQIRAAISALHSQAPRYEETDWYQIVILYDVLYTMLPSPVIALNRAVAVAMTAGSDKGLRLLDQLAQTAELNNYYLFHAARADLLRRTNRLDEARNAYSLALKLC